METRRPNLAEELNTVKYGSFPEIFEKFRSLASEYGNLSPAALTGAFGTVGGFGDLYTPNPYVQNARVKGISSQPINVSKDEVADFLKNPTANERKLRQVEHELEYTAYPMMHMRTTYANLLTYHSYVAPYLTERDDVKKDEFWREWKLMEKLRSKICPEDKAHEVAGQALQEGKVFYYARVSADKPHNAIHYAFLQQLPSDWVKIVGFNNKSKYTVAFNLMYFTQYGTTWRQFGDLFEPYMTGFNEIVTPAPKLENGRIVYASKTGLDLSRMKNSAAEAYYQNGKWYYWVTLPVEKVFTFEIDDTNRAVVSPFTGLFIDMIQLSQMEQIQLALLQNPLVSLLHGEIPYWDEKGTNDADQYKLSNAGRILFTTLWQQMMAESNTSGIGLYMAPLENMKLESLSEAPSAMDIVKQGYEDTMSKAGLTGIIPSSAEARAGAVQVSLQIESRFADRIYTCFERMMNVLMENLNPKYSWRFKMFGDLASDEKTEKSAMTGMEHGILPDAITYNALKGRSILEDMAISDAIAESGLMDKRYPLISSYNAKQEASGIPPQGGRPKSEGVTSDGQESDLDGGTA